MSNIRNKISSIEADDDVVVNALGLRPIDDNEIVERAIEPQTPKLSRSATVEDDVPMPAIVSRNATAASTYEDAPSNLPTSLIFSLGLLWLIGTCLTVVFVFGLSEIGDYSPMQFTGLAFFILFPLVLFALLFAGLRHFGQLTTRAAGLEQATNSLLRVDETVIRRATEMSGVVKREIDVLNSGIDTALTRAATLQGVLKDQTQQLGETTIAVEDKTQKIAERLATEREALWSISNTFDKQMKALTQTLDENTEKLALSTKTAEQKIQEARVSVERTAAKINQTSDLVRSNTMEAAATLSDNQSNILKLSEELKSSAQALDTIYQKHGQDLGAMIAQLQNEQEALNISLEERLSKMRDVALSAQVSAERLTEASEAGRRTVVSLSEAANVSESTIRQRFSEVEEMVKFSNARAESISEKAARRVQDSLAQTRKEIARIEDDMLGLEQKLTRTSDVSTYESDPESYEQPPEPSNETDDIIETDDIEDIETMPVKRTRGGLNIRPVEDIAGLSGGSSAPSPSHTLRPAPTDDPDANFADQEIDNANDDLKIPTLHGASKLDLKIDEDIIQPTVSDIPSRALGDDTIRRTAKETESSGSWWKGLFGKGTPETRSIDTLTAPETRPAASSPIPSTPEQVMAPDRRMVPQAPSAPQRAKPEAEKLPPKVPEQQAFLNALEKNGLSPNAIVDDGTIHRAVETRITKGTKQMSIEVANHLGEPVQHFTRLINADEALKTQAINFAVKFHHSLSPLSSDADAMRAHLQSEQGRLFLMCDAALNN